jgi:hypothetical protein
MPAVKVTAKDRERLARARARGDARAEDPSAIVDARYDAARDAIELEFRSGGVITVPRQVVPGLVGVSASALHAIRVSPAGDALSWPSLDADLYVPGARERRQGWAAAQAIDGIDVRAAAQAPWQNSFVERFIGSAQQPRHLASNPFTEKLDSGRPPKLPHLAFLQSRHGWRIRRPRAGTRG